MRHVQSVQASADSPRSKTDDPSLMVAKNDMVRAASGLIEMLRIHLIPGLIGTCLDSTK